MNKIFSIAILIACVSTMASAEVTEPKAKVRNPKTQSINRSEYVSDIYSVEEDDDEEDQSYDKGTVNFRARIVKSKNKEKVFRKVETIGSNVYLTTKSDRFKRIKYIGSNNSN